MSVERQARLAVSGLRPDAETARFLVDRFGLHTESAARLSPVARGATGRVWRLSTAGHVWAVKELFSDPAEATVAATAAFRDAAASAGVRAPASLRSVQGRYLCRLPAGLGGRMVRVSEWVDGRPVAPDDPGRAEWIGAALGRLAALDYPATGPVDPWYDESPDDRQWQALTSAGVAAGQPWAELLRTRTPRLNALGRVVTRTAAAAVVCCHLDPQPSNVLIDATGRYTLLDWDDAGPGRPDRVLFGALCDWHVHGGRLDPDGVRTTMAAYRRAGGRAEMAGTEVMGSHIAAYLNYIAVLAHQALDATAPPGHRERARDTVHALLTDLPAPDVLRAVLVAARADHGAG
jgi:Ser/Thr protein kinase RdoA (MazF antagonist)